MKNTAHFDTALSKVFDHLYANAKHRTPGAIEAEIRKIILAAIYLEKNVNPLQPAFYVSSEERKQYKQSTELALGYAGMIRDSYSKASNGRGSKKESPEIQLSNFDLVYCCLEFAEISFSAEDRDVFGDAVELFRSHWSKSQGGQFFTDQRVTELAIELVDFNGTENENLVDLCAGTGGFIIAALKHLNRNSKIPGKYPESHVNKVHGIEVDNSVAGIGNEAISALTGNSFTVIKTADSLTLTPKTLLRKDLPLTGSVTHAVTNPPFGAKILVKDPAILSLFNLTKQRKQSSPKPLPLDVLFIEQNYNILKEGGKLAIILPFQTLSGPQSTWIRKWILARFHITAVIDLPSETFQPYTGTKTSLLVMEKRTGGIKTQKQPIFMACPQHIGHDRRGNPVWQKDTKGNEIDKVHTDLPNISSTYLKWKTEKELTDTTGLCYTVQKKEILNNNDLRIDARFYKPSEANSRLSKLKTAGRFEILKLRDVCSKIFYPGRFKRSYTDDTNGSVPFLGGTNISQLILATEKRVSVEDENYDKLKVSKGWILITRSGSTGIVSTVAESWDGFAISEHVIRIVPNEDRISSPYLYAFLQTKIAQDYIRRGVFGSVIDELSPEYLGEMEVLIPINSMQKNEIQTLISSGLKSRDEAVNCLTLANFRLNSILEDSGRNSRKKSA